MSSPKIVLYDACVLYPAPLRDVLVQIALGGMFQGKWTEKIHDEWMRNVLKNRPDLTLEQLQRTRTLMNRSVPNCAISGYQFIESELFLPDPDDRHVLAAAIHGNVEAIVTFNLSDFPEIILDRYDIVAVHPDDFLVELFNDYPNLVINCLRSCHSRLRNPPKAWSEYIDTLAQQGLINFASQLRLLSN